MAKYQFSEDAIKDINEICDYLAKNNPRSASNLFYLMRFAKNVSYFLIFRIWGNHMQKLDLIYEGF